MGPPDGTPVVRVRAAGDPPTVPLPVLDGDACSPGHRPPAWPDASPRWDDGPPHHDTDLQHRPAGPTPPDRRGPGGRVGRGATLLRRWVPDRLRGARVDPGRSGATALALVAAVAAVVAAVGVWSGRPQVEPVTELPTVAISTTTVDPAAEPTAAPGTSAAPATLVVSVAGKVTRPGLVRVPDGARVADVLDAAGGPLPGTDLTGLNLARRVSDGEQVAVGVPAAPDATDAAGAAPGEATAGGSDETPDGKVDLNSATEQQLDALPGVGPVTAGRILEWRTRNGRFVRVDQLREIEGIGERRFGQLRDLVTV